jgi:hypothetical protein
MPIRGFDIEEAVALFEKTPSWGAVARALSTKDKCIHPYSVQSALEPLGYKTVRGAGHKRTWDVDKATEMRGKKQSYGKISRVLKVSETAVRKAMMELHGPRGGKPAF